MPPRSSGEHAKAGDDPVGIRGIALSAAASLVAGRGSNRSDRGEVLVDEVLDLAERFAPWLASGKRGS